MLARILLSSLQGVAVTAVRMDGVLHEFSTIPDVVEDVADIILNLKEVRFKLYVEGPKTVVVEKEGPGIVTAADIQVDDTVEVLNPEQHICTLAKRASSAVNCAWNMEKDMFHRRVLRRTTSPQE